MLAFHNNPAIKEKYLARVRAHRVADEIVKGRYWENGKGCAVGCTLHSGKHMSYESELGIPVALAHLEDTIFENLPNELALEWPARFLEAAHPGADLSNVVNQFMSWMLIDPTHGVIRFVNTDMDRSAIIGVAAILRTDATAEEIEKALSADSAADSAAALSAALSARSAALSAYSAADSAAALSAACSVADSVDSAADSARSAAAARSAARSAVDSARSAALSADSAAYSAADSAYISFSDKLIELMSIAR